jgi:glucose/arabinose dehydrogenase
MVAGVRAEFPQIGYDVVSSGELSTPIGMTHANDGSGRLFVIDQRGKIQILQNGQVLPTPFLDLSSDLVPQRTTGSGQTTFDERGLLSLAFHPDYATPGADGEGKFYVNYSAPHPDAPGTTEDPIDHMSVLAEYRVSPGNPNQADPSSGRVLMTVNEPQFNHNAGQLAFSNRPGEQNYLYWSLGDGGSSNDNNAGHTGGDPTQPNGVLGNAQDRTKLLGKVLRLDVNGSNSPNGQYGIPADNPFVGEGGGVREEIYAYGLRNPWRFSFDDGPGGSGDLFLADVGQRLYEEVNIIEAGGNYGWRVMEGLHDFDPTTPATGPFEDPILEYSHPNAPDGTQIGISATGGYVYRGSEFPELFGKYIFGDWSTSFGVPSGHLLGAEEIAPGQWQLTILDVEGGNPLPYFINAFGEDEYGELYVLANMFNQPGPVPGGVILKITPEPATSLMMLAGAGLMLGRSGRRERR